VLLSIDPGETTGVVLLTEVGLAALATELKSNAHDTLEYIASIANVTDTVIEQGPMTRDNQHLEDLDAGLRRLFPDATWIRPVDWKNHPAAKVASGNGKISTKGMPHVRDALGMGLVYQATR